jgi:hypothetical protein
MSTGKASLPAAHVYLIMVTVRYTHRDNPGEQARRNWFVRIVATNEESASMGAMNYAVRQKDETIKAGSEAFAEQAVYAEVLAGVDCIAASLKS